MPGDCGAKFEEERAGPGPEQRPLHSDQPLHSAGTSGHESGDAGGGSPFSDAVHRAEEAARGNPHAQRIGELQQKLTELHDEVRAIEENLPNMADMVARALGFLESLERTNMYPSGYKSAIRHEMKDVVRIVRSALSMAQGQARTLGREIDQVSSELASLRGNPAPGEHEAQVIKLGEERVKPTVQVLEHLLDKLPRSGT